MGSLHQARFREKGFHRPFRFIRPESIRVAELGEIPRLPSIRLQKLSLCPPIAVKNQVNPRQGGARGFRDVTIGNDTGDVESRLVWFQELPGRPAAIPPEPPRHRRPFPPSVPRGKSFGSRASGVSTGGSLAIVGATASGSPISYEPETRSSRVSRRRSPPHASACINRYRGHVRRGPTSSHTRSDTNGVMNGPGNISSGHMGGQAPAV